MLIRLQSCLPTQKPRRSRQAVPSSTQRLRREKAEVGFAWRACWTARDSGMAGTLFGIGVGALAGLIAAPRFLGSSDQPNDMRRYGTEADQDPSVPDPSTQDPVPLNVRQYLSFAPKWTTWPDYQRVFWMNHALRTLWPYYNKAIGKMVLEQAKPMIEEQIKPYGFVQAVDIEAIDMGTRPLAVGGVKVYQTSEDEGIFECPMGWGSNARVRVSARLKLGPFVFYVPVEVCNLQMRGLARITLKPMTDEIPCIGAVTVTLMDDPYVDFTLRLMGSFDLMQIPGVNYALSYGIELALGSMIRYPNQMSFDIMENGGMLPPPQGVLLVEIVRMDKIVGGGRIFKADPYIVAGIKQNRRQRTRTLSNTTHPVWEETLNIIVNDPDKQSLTFELMDDDPGAFDDNTAVGKLPLKTSGCIANPGTTETLHIALLKPEAHQQLVQYAKMGQEEAQKKKDAKEKARQDAEKGRQASQPPPPASSGKAADESKDGPSEAVNEAGVTEDGHVDTTAAGKEEKSAVVGHLEVNMRYVPFVSKGVGSFKKGQDSVPDRTKPSPAETATEKETRAKQPDSPTHPESRGILTVEVTQAKSLEAEGKVDPFVELVIQDPTREHEEDQRQISTCVPNEPSPRWGDKFDFIDVSPSSSLLVTVWDKKGTLESFMSFKALKGKRETTQNIGHVKINIKDVVRNRRLQDVWALQGVQKGDIYLTLDWTPVVLEKGWNRSMPNKSDHKEQKGKDHRRSRHSK